MTKFRKLARGRSAVADDDDDVVMTQKSILNFKCPILQVLMRVWLNARSRLVHVMLIA